MLAGVSVPDDDVRTDALAQLRAVLLQEYEWRQREGLS